MRTGGVEPPQRWATRLQRAELAVARRPQGIRKAGSAPRNRRQRRCRLCGSGASCYPIGTPASACPRRHLLTGRPWRLLEASCTLGPRSAPALFRHFLGPSVDGPFLVDCAGGIRTHGLELMRLAGTAAPLPRYLAGWSRTSALRLPKPAGWPSSPTASCPSSRRPWNRTTLDRHIRAAPRRSACRRCLSAKRSDPPPYGRGTPLKASPSAPQLPGRATGAARELHPAPRGHGPRARSLALQRSLAGRSRTPVPPR